MAQVGKYTISVERDELNTILAALRYYQNGGMGEPSSRPDWLQEIACPDDDATSLADSEIDRLCEEINCSAQAPERAEARLVVELEGGLVQGIYSDVPARVLVVDYDVEGADDDEVEDMGDNMACPHEETPMGWETMSTAFREKVALIFDENDQPDDSGNAGCDRCGMDDRAEGSRYCAECGDAAGSQEIGRAHV